MTTPRCRPFALLALALAGGAVGLEAAEVGTTRLVFEKSAKLKKVRASVYLSFDGRADAPKLDCGVMARDEEGALAVTGSLRLHLVGESENGTEMWESSTLGRTLHFPGDASFTAEEIATLAEEASAAGAAARWARIDYRGGRGGKATELTLDCQLEESAG